MFTARERKPQHAIWRQKKELVSIKIEDFVFRLQRRQKIRKNAQELAWDVHQYIFNFKII